MDQFTWWKNFALGEEIEISGNLIYESVNKFKNMRNFSNDALIFDILYNLAVGIERLQKTIIAFYQETDNFNDEILKILYSHNHMLLAREIVFHYQINFTKEENSLFSLLEQFYNNARYDNFTINNIHTEKSTKMLNDYFKKYLNIEIETNSFIPTFNTKQITNKFTNIISMISKKLFNVFKNECMNQSLYAYELPPESGASEIFYGVINNQNIPSLLSSEEISKKELMIYLINYKHKPFKENKAFRFIKKIKPLDFDIYDVIDYLNDYILNNNITCLKDFVKAIYEELNDEEIANRKELLELAMNPNVDWDL